MADERTVDVNVLRFGDGASGNERAAGFLAHRFLATAPSLVCAARRAADFEGVEFMANSSAGIILQALADSKYATKRPPECVAAAGRCRRSARPRWSPLIPRPAPPPPACRRACRVFQKALEFCTRFGGAVETRDTAAIDELYAAMRALSFPRSAPDGSIVKLALHDYQVRGGVAWATLCSPDAVWRPARTATALTPPVPALRRRCCCRWSRCRT